MKELAFKHETNQALYDKSMLKYTKMIETESGRKFFSHLVKAFIQSGTVKKVEDIDNLSGLTACDLTHAKLVTAKSQFEFHAIYKAKLSTFARLDNESDEAFEQRRDAYVDAFKSSNPYAVNADFAYTADKTDKVLCAEAISALTDFYKKIMDNKSDYPELVKIIQPYQPKKSFKKKDKSRKDDQKPKKKGFYESKSSVSNSFADLPAFKSLKAKFK